MKRASSQKNSIELLLPGAEHWEKWNISKEGEMRKVEDYSETAEGHFTTDFKQRVLALPTSAFWHLPLWLSGESEHFPSMAQLHLERLGIKSVGGLAQICLTPLVQEGEQHLLSIKTLKNQNAPLSSTSALPTQCIAATDCFSLVPNSVSLWRELGRLVMAVTTHDKIVYQAPLTALNFDDEALAEIKQTCFQMAFQQSLPAVERFVLWIEEVDTAWREAISLSLSLPVEVLQPRVPKMREDFPVTFVLPDLKLKEKIELTRKRRRFQLIFASLLFMGLIAAMFALQLVAALEHEKLLDELNMLTPLAAQIELQRSHWEEVSPALDPQSFPTRMLLSFMESPVSADISLMRFEWTPQRVMVQAHALSTNAALQYAQDIRSHQGLGVYDWVVPAPTIAEDDSATFEMTGLKKGGIDHE